MIVPGKTMRAVEIVRKIVWYGTGCVARRRRGLFQRLEQTIARGRAAPHLVVFERRPLNRHERVHGERFRVFWHAGTRPSALRGEWTKGRNGRT